MIKNIDFGQDGNIQFTEFLVAASKKQLLFSNENLLAAFQHFDVDRDGRIQARDIAAMFEMTLAEFKLSSLGKSYEEILENEAAEKRKFEEMKAHEACKIKIGTENNEAPTIKIIEVEVPSIVA